MAQATIDVTLQAGGLYIDDTAAHAGKFRAITALAAAVATLVSTTDKDGFGGKIRGTLTSVPIPVGTTIYGCFTSITLASGKVIAYDA